VLPPLLSSAINLYQESDKNIVYGNDVSPYGKGILVQGSSLGLL
jgi:hypothetical protein